MFRRIKRFNLNSNERIRENSKIYRVYNLPFKKNHLKINVGLCDYLIEFENSKIEITIYFFKKDNFSVILLYSKSSFFKIQLIININFLPEILLYSTLNA